LLFFHFSRAAESSEEEEEVDIEIRLDSEEETGVTKEKQATEPKVEEKPAPSLMSLKKRMSFTSFC
jgi:hypothetical protein